ncbi:MAG TPA: hypothetical protein VHV75_04105 [Solirubrobacteraceae bacterium]|nr:hypothetical protein [Solirubrobacteraceae bacterium]
MGEITMAEDRVHYPWPGTNWIESYWFGFVDPEQRIGLVSLIGFNPGQSRSRLWVHIFEGDRCTVTETQLDLPLAVPDGAVVQVGAYRLEFVEDLQEFAISYNDADAALDLRWTGSSEVKGTTGGRPFPGQIEADPHGHSEQAGTVSGSLRVGERSYTVNDAYGWRDHLWGHAITDGWSEMGWWAWLVGSTEDRRLSFNVTSHRFLDGRTGNYGFMFVDGKVNRIWVDDCTMKTDESGKHPTACDIRFTNRDTGIGYLVHGETLGPLFMQEPVPAGGVCVINDAPSRFMVNDQVAYGTIEMGNVWES